MTIFLSNTDIEKYQTTVKKVVNRLLSSRRYFHLYTEREDLFQIGWVVLLNCCEKYDASRGVSFETYISRAISYEVKNELRRLIAEQKNTSAEDILAYKLPKFKDTYMKRLVETVETTNLLTIRMKQIFWLRFIDEQSFTQIGKTIGVSREYVRKLYYQSVKILKEHLSDGKEGRK